MTSGQPPNYQSLPNNLEVIGRVADFSGFDYPGKRPDESYITNGEEVYALRGNGHQIFDEINAYLEQQDLPALKDRIPVLAYGGNASPGSLKEKFSRHDLTGYEVTEKEIQTVPCIFGDLQGVDVVWHGAPSLKGGYFAELYKGKEAEGTTVQAVVQFLTTEQLAIMHTTEGITYEFADIGEVDFGNEVRMQSVLSYVGRGSSILLDDYGKPISVAGVKRSNSDLEVLDVKGALDYTLGNEKVTTAIKDFFTDNPEYAECHTNFASSPDRTGAYSNFARAISPAKRRELQQRVSSAMNESGIACAMRFPIDIKNIYTTGGFSMLPRVGRPGQPLKNGDKPEDLAVGYVEYRALSRLQRSPEEQARRYEKIQAAHPEYSAEQIYAKAEPIWYALGRLAVAAAKYYKPELTTQLEG